MGRWALVRIQGENAEQFLRLGLQAAGSQFNRVFLGLAGLNDLPIHQSSALLLWSSGSAMPALMASRMPGAASKYRVS